MDDVRWLEPEELRAWIMLAKLLFLMPSALDGQLTRDADLNMGDYMVLAILSNEPGPALRMSELAVRAGCSQSRLSRIVGRLERADLVQRTMSPDDRRVVMAELTETGVRRIAAAAPGHLREVRRLVFDRLSDEQVQMLAEVGEALLGQDALPPPPRSPK
ncbi:MarR family winged helix-turn-helix transcriptional regulator [uncultured Friedmanniella sp.]|uniref:MarR family winged helix-turn-helix transcriptional regulator n=1 Tax=uncultured Friedmanniella sp. TaxID=335381 RepID=UPI0035CB4C93